MSKWETHTIHDLTREKRCIKFFVNDESPIFAGVMDMQEPITVGDALVIRDELLAAGFVFGKDFVIRKRNKQQVEEPK